MVISWYNILMKTQTETIFPVNQLDMRTPEEIAYDSLMDGAGFSADEAAYMADLTDQPPYVLEATNRELEELFPRELGMLPVGDYVSQQLTIED